MVVGEDLFSFKDFLVIGLVGVLLVLQDNVTVQHLLVLLAGGLGGGGQSKGTTRRQESVPGDNVDSVGTGPHTAFPLS